MEMSRAKYVHGRGWFVSMQGIRDEEGNVTFLHVTMVMYSRLRTSV